MDISEQRKIARANTDARIAREQKESIEKNAPEVDSALSGMSDESVELFKRIVAKDAKDKNIDKATLDLFNKADATKIKSLYSNEMKSSLNELAGQGLSKQEMLDKWHASLAVSAKQMGAIDKLDDRTLQTMLKEKTFEPEFEKYSVVDGLKIALRNQYEGIQYAGIAAVALAKGDKNYYLEKAGGELAANKDKYGWWDVASDLMTAGNTGSETGGKFFLADLVFLPTSPLTGGLGVLAKGGIKGLIKAGGKGATKATIKSLEKKTIQEMIEAGATVELKGLGAKWIDKDVTKIATKRAEKELAEKGGKLADGITSNLINKHKAEIIKDGLSATERNHIFIKNMALGAADLANLPIGTLSTRELVKVGIGYGVPVLSGVSEGVSDVASYFTQAANKAVQLYSTYNVTEYEKQLASEFIKMTGADPLSPDFGAKEAWNDFKSFKIRNEGAATLIFGKKEGSGKFWNFFADSIANMAGMGVAMKGVNAGGSAISNKLAISATADLTNKINEIRNSDRFSGKLDLNVLKEDIDAFTKEVEAIEMKSTPAQDIKLLNRANQLLEAIVSKSERLTVNNPVLAAKIDELYKKISQGDIKYDEAKDAYKNISQVTKEIILELENNVDKTHFFRESAELKKISEYFNELQSQNTFASNLRLSIARNLANGSKPGTISILGGVSAAEALASKNPFLNDYLVNRALSSAEVAKSIALSKELELKHLQFMRNVVDLERNQESPFMSSISSAVERMVKQQFSQSDKAISDKIKKSVISEGITKVLEVYNSLPTSITKPGIGESYLNLNKLVGSVLSDSFGLDILNSVASKNNTTVSKFLKYSDSIDQQTLTKNIKEAFNSPDNIFNPKSSAAAELTERYRNFSEKAKTTARELAEKQQVDYNAFLLEVQKLKDLQEKMSFLKMIGIKSYESNPDGTYSFNNKTYKTENGVQSAMSKAIKAAVKEHSNDLPKNEVIPTITKDDMNAFLNDKFGGFNEFIQQRHIFFERNLLNIQNNIMRVFNSFNPGKIDVEPKTEDFIEESESDKVATSNKTLNDFVNKIEKKSGETKIILTNEPKVSDLTKLSKILNIDRTNSLKVEQGVELNSKINKLQSDLEKASRKKDKTINLASVTEESLHFTKMSLQEIARELDQKQLSLDEQKVLELKYKRLEGSLLKLEESKQLAEGRSEKADVDVYKGIIENELKLLESNIEDIKQLKIEMSAEFDASQKLEKIEKQTGKTIKSLNEKINVYSKELDNLLGERDSLVELLSENPLGKKSLSELAKSTKTAEEFYANLSLLWKDLYKEDIDKSLVNPKSLGYKAIYNTLKNYTETYKDGTPIEKIIINIEKDGSVDGESNYKQNLSFGNHKVELSSGKEIPTGKVLDVLTSTAEDNGFKISEVANVSYAGKDIEFSSIFANEVSNSVKMKKWEAKTVDIKTSQDAAYKYIADSISKKTHVGVVTKFAEEVGQFLSSLFSSGKNTASNSKLIQSSLAEIGQASTDGKINPGAANMIYYKFIKPIADKAEKAGYVLLGSIDEEGKRLFFTKIQEGQTAKQTFDNFHRKVTSIDPDKLIKDDKPLKRIKNMASSEIPMDSKSLNDYYKSNNYERAIDKDGNSMIRALIIDDEAYNKYTAEVAPGVKKTFVTTDGMFFYLPKFHDFINHEVGLKDDLVNKSSAFVPGDKGFVLKGMGKTLTGEEVIKDYFNALGNDRDITSISQKYDMIITKSSLKELSHKYTDGDVVDLPANSFRVKRLDNTLKPTVSGAAQIFNIIPRILPSNPEWTKLYDAAMDEVLIGFEDRITEFKNVLERINLNKPGAVEELMNSNLFKDISGDDFMSRAISDIRAGGGLKNSNKGLIFNHIMNVFRQDVLRMKFDGSEAHLLGVGNYKKLAETITSKYKDQGVTDKNFIILDKKYWSKKVYKNGAGLPEVLAYRYPVNKASNVTVLKVIWSDDPDVKPLIGDIGNKTILNMYDVFINKEGDFDIDKINIVHDKRIKDNFLKMAREISKQKEFQFLVDVKGKTTPFNTTDLKEKMFNPTSGGINAKGSKSLIESVDEKLKYYKFLNKLNSKYTEFKTPGKFFEFISEARERVEQEKSLKLNPTEGKSFIERLILSPVWNDFTFSDIKINGSVEYAASAYANKSVGNLIKDKNYNTRIQAFDKLNDEFKSALQSVDLELSKIKTSAKSSLINKVSITESNGKLSLVDYNKESKSLDYHERVLEKLTKDLNKERPAKNSKNEDWVPYNKKKSFIENEVEITKNKIDTEKSKLEADKNKISRSFETKANISLKKDFLDDKDAQRYAMITTWGNDKKATFLVSKDINAEYNKYYNQKYLSEDLDSSFGIRIDESDTQKISNAYDKQLKAMESGDLKAIEEASAEIKSIIDDVTINRIQTADFSETKLKPEDVEKLGRFSKFFTDIHSELSIKDYSHFSMRDINDIKKLADAYIEKTDDLSLITINVPQKLKQIKRISKDLENLKEQRKDKGVNYAFIRESIEDKMMELKTVTAELLIGSYDKSLIEAKTQTAIVDAIAKQPFISDGSIKDQERIVKSAEYQKNKTDKLITELKEKERIFRTIQQLIPDKKLQEEFLYIARTGDAAAKEALYQKLSEDYKDKSQQVLANFFITSSKHIIDNEVSSVLKDYNAQKELEESKTETSREILKLEESRPTDFLSQLFEVTTKAYKSLAVGIAAGRGIAETANASISTLSKAVEKLNNSGISEKYLTEKFGKTENFMIPTSKFNGEVYSEFIGKTLTEASAPKRNKILNNFAKSLSNIAGVISGKIVNVVPSKLAEQYYRMEFLEAIYKEVAKNDGDHRQKLYLLKDPSKLSIQDRQQYYATMSYIEGQAKSATEKAFFNYETNPLVIHKLENALPFTNFMYSGFKLFKRHPKSILAVNILVDSLINNYGEQVGFVMDDENGDPVKVDYGKKLKLPLLGMYGGASFNLNRLMQFSPTDTKLGMTPIFSYMSGDFDWRVKAWRNGEMSGLELVAGAISPSISQLAAGIYEDDYQKRFSGLSYLMTGLAAKSGAHSKIANDFYIKQDYEAVKNAPDSVKKHLFDQYNDKTKSKPLDEDSLDSLIEAKKLGLLGEPTKRNSFGIYEKKDAFKDAVRINAQIATLAAEGKTDPLYNEDYYKKLGRDAYYFSDWVMGSLFYEKSNNGDFDEWIKKIKEFADAGHLDRFEKINQPLGSTMRHYYENIDYYKRIREASKIAYDSGSRATQTEKSRAQAEIIALKYELIGAGSSLNQKIDSLMNGNVQFIVDKDGFPKMTKEREAQLTFQGAFVEEYEDDLSNHMMYRDTKNFYNSLGHKSVELGDKKGASFYFNMAKHNNQLMIDSFKKVEELHSDKAEIFTLKKELSSPAPTPKELSKEGYYLTKPIYGYIEKRNQSLEEFYNELSTKKEAFIQNNDNNWSSFTNEQKSLFMSLNNGKTLNQARKEMEQDSQFFKDLADHHVKKTTNDTIKLIESIYE